jgi:hypothetical protein
MRNTFKKITLAAGLSMLSIGSLAAMAAPAAARVVCDWDGDDCYRTRPYGYGYDSDWRRDWYARHEWREHREAERYWRHRRYDDDYRPYSGANMWFNF